MQAIEIKDKLKSLIIEASTLDPSLAIRLEEINRWVKDVKPGSLTAKRFVIFFLIQIVKDSQIWLDIKALATEEEQQSYYQEMTPTEKYWYGELFPKWLRENDPKFHIWKQKLMGGMFHQEDADLVKSIAHMIKHRQGTVVQRYIADLSMATDIIISSREEQPLCLQLTTISAKFSQKKSEDWENTLRFWEIEKGLFLSFNPRETNFVNLVVNIALYNSNNLRRGVYLKFIL